MTETVIVTDEGCASGELVARVCGRSAEETVTAAIATPDAGASNGEVRDVGADWGTYRIRHGSEMVVTDVASSSDAGLVLQAGRGRRGAARRLAVRGSASTASRPGSRWRSPVTAHAGVLAGRSLTWWPALGTALWHAGTEGHATTVVVDATRIAWPSGAERGPWMKTDLDL